MCVCITRLIYPASVLFNFVRVGVLHIHLLTNILIEYVIVKQLSNSCLNWEKKTIWIWRLLEDCQIFFIGRVMYANIFFSIFLFACCVFTAMQYLETRTRFIHTTATILWWALRVWKYYYNTEAIDCNWIFAMKQQ